MYGLKKQCFHSTIENYGCSKSTLLQTGICLYKIQYLMYRDGWSHLIFSL